MSKAHVHRIAVLWVAGMTAVVFAQTSLEENAERAARDAWVAARALVGSGGALDQLGPVTERLKEIERVRGIAIRTPSVDGAHVALGLRYADAAVRAAIAAAQDERDEMNVFLGYAKIVGEQLAGMGGVATWPLRIDELEGELWLEVDRYTEAHGAYLRAIANGGGARAWLGLARANDRLGNSLAACDAFRRAMTGALDEADKTESLNYLSSARCQLARRR